MPQLTELTAVQTALLEMPFKYEEHAFVTGKGVYIRKSAIRARLTLVDPNWTMTEPRLLAHTDQIVVMTAGLTVCGVTRYGVGVGVIQALNSPAKQLAEISKAFKTAAIDCLPRAADLFGVGAYLRDVPKASKATPEALARWLAGQSGAAPARPEPTPRAGRSWMDNPAAVDALEARLKQIHPELTPARAAELVGKSLATFPGLEAAVKAIAAAHAEQLAIEDPA